MRCIIVSHTHWDREWYRSFQAFRARLVDTVDRVLDLVAEDAGYFFQLDGQSIAAEDYLAIRPARREELEAACRMGRIEIGPWYVQPDSLLPSGEAHIRNLLEGRRVAQSFGQCCRIAYTPDSFGHPAQFPQLFAGFGLDPFVYWRGNGDEIESLGNEYLWRAPDGSTVRCEHLAKGYFSAWGFSRDVAETVKRLQTLALELHQSARHDCVLLMNGFDHMLPDENTREVAEALAQQTGWEVERGLLDTFAQSLPEKGLAEFSGELLGGRVANLLPGVWSTRVPLKLANRRCEAALEGWAEPWATLALATTGLTYEVPALRSAWRSLLQNQAHDSICGCSRDLVHQQMHTRYQMAQELADETTQRLLERLAGLGVTRQVAQQGEIELAVFNPSPHPRTDLVRMPLDGFPAFTSVGLARLLAANIGAQGFEVDGCPARLIALDETSRPSPVPDQPIYDLEFVAQDVPAFGWKRVTLRPSPPHSDFEDDGTCIENAQLRVNCDPDGTLRVRTGTCEWSGLAALEDCGDRGDTYDFDALEDEATTREAWPCEQVRTRRYRYASGIQELEISRTLSIPKGLTRDRRARSREHVVLPVTMVARIAEGVERVDLALRLTNTAMDHRLRLLFPTGSRVDRFHAATTFDSAIRHTDAPNASHWLHPAPTTFPHQGWIAAGSLVVAAPGLAEAEVTPEGCIKLTLVRAVGRLSRADLRSRPGVAGPTLATPGAQCLETMEMALSLFEAPIAHVPSLARDAELGLRAVAAGPTPLVPCASPLLCLMPQTLVFSALKPAQSGEGVILRVLNPTPNEERARITLGFAIGGARAVRLDESASNAPLTRHGRNLEFVVPPHALRSVLLH